MRRFLAALTLAMLAGSTGIWTTGCARTIDPSDAGRAGVAYLHAGCFLPDDSLGVLDAADADERRRQFAAASVRLEGVFAVPKRTFEWLIKQAAELRQLREGAVDN